MMGKLRVEVRYTNAINGNQHKKLEKTYYF